MALTEKPEKIKFDPPELQRQLLAAKKELGSIIEWSFFPLDDNYDPDAYDELVITLDTEVDDMALVGAEEEDCMTVGELLDLAEWAKHGSLIDNGTLHCDTQTVFHLNTESDRAFHMAYNDLPHSINDANLSIDVTIDGSICNVSVVQGSMPFALFVEKHIDYEKDYYPPYSPHYIFAIVKHPSNISVEVARDICDAFLVELAISHNFIFNRSIFPEYNPLSDPENYYIENDNITYLFRPLDLSLGMGELYQLYLTATNASDPAWRFVSYVKLIEYISITVIRRTIHGEIRRRLMRPEALRPDAAFIDELVGLFGTQREYSKQKEAIKRTIAECCILPKLVIFAPAFLVNVRKVDDKTKDIASALDELSEAIVATRNFLVHAKAAYEKTGKECPDEQLSQFTQCLQEIAGQLIIWFGSLPEHERIVG